MARDFPNNGANRLIVADAAGIDITGTLLTMSVWVNTDKNNVAQIIIEKSNAPGGGGAYQYGMDITALGKASPYVGDSGGIDQATGATTVTTGVWHHICGVKNGTGAGALRIFLDGVDDGNITSNRTIQNTAHSLHIGCQGGDFTNPFDGRIAELALWDAALTQGEITALAKGFSPLLVRPQSLRGYWPIIGRASPEPNLVRGENATVTGTPSQADHPRILLPAPVLIGG